MSDSNVVEIVSTLRDSGVDESVLYRLAALGINYVYSSYRSDKVELMRQYGMLPKKVLIEMWDDLDVKLKVEYVNENSEDFKEWMRNG